MTNIIDLKYKIFEKEINRIIKNNNGDGWHRLKAIIIALQESGKLDGEIIEELKKIEYI